VPEWVTGDVMPRQRWSQGSSASADGTLRGKVKGAGEMPALQTATEKPAGLKAAAICRRIEVTGFILATALLIPHQTGDCSDE
jgi:hypothetical protein